MSEVAYGKRNLFTIRIKSIISLVIHSIKKHGSKIISPNPVVRNIGVRPPISDAQALGDIINRIAWGFPHKPELSIYIETTPELLNTDLQLLKVPDSQNNYLTNFNLSHVKLVKKLPKKMDSYLVHNVRKLLTPDYFLKIPKTYIIDKNFFSYVESRTWRDGYWETLSKKEKREIIQLSENNFSSLKESVKGITKSYCYVTGPSFDQYRSFDFEEKSIKIICNSVVKNRDFLDYIKKPNVLTFADPVFHFSSNNYSAAFRNQALECLNQYDTYIVVPLRAVPLLLTHYPQIKSRIIGIDWGWSMHFPSEESLLVKNAPNILTYMMIPVASSLSTEVNILGADGRQSDEKYFWRHSKTAQYDDLMKDVFETHPSFFRDRDYKDYYKNHCENLEELLRFGEEKGNVYYSVTRSYIPAFIKRYKTVSADKPTKN